MEQKKDIRANVCQKTVLFGTLWNYLSLFNLMIVTTRVRIEHTAITVVPIAVTTGEISYTIVFTYLSEQCL